MSKLNQEKLRQQIEQVFEQSKKRQFTQSIDMQVLLRDYNPMKEKRLNSIIDLPHKCRTNMKIVAICNVNHRDECVEAGIDYIDLDGVKLFGKDRTAVKKWARKYDLVLVSSNMNRKVIKSIGKALSSVQRLPIQVPEKDSMKGKIEELFRSARFRTKKVAWLGTSVGVETLENEDLRQNLVKSVNFLVSILPKGWFNIRSINVKTTMGKPVRIF